MFRKLIKTLRDSNYFTELLFSIISLFLIIPELVLYLLFYIFSNSRFGFSNFSLISLDSFVSIFDNFNSFNVFLFLFFIVVQIILTTIALFKFIFNKHKVNKHYWASLFLIIFNYIFIFLLLYLSIFRNYMYLDFNSI